MRLLPFLLALVFAASGLSDSIAQAQSDDHEMLLPGPESPMPSAASQGAASSADEPIFAPPPARVQAPPVRVYRRVRHRPRITPPGAYEGHYNFYNDPHTVHYWSPSLPYYDPTHGYNSFRPLPPQSRHYRGPANPHNTGWGISF